MFSHLPTNSIRNNRIVVMWQDGFWFKIIVISESFHFSPLSFVHFCNHSFSYCFFEFCEHKRSRFARGTPSEFLARSIGSFINGRFSIQEKSPSSFFGFVYGSNTCVIAFNRKSSRIAQLKKPRYNLVVKFIGRNMSIIKSIKPSFIVSNTDCRQITTTSTAWGINTKK